MKSSSRTVGKPVHPADLAILHGLLEATASEMGVALMRAALSVNIKERRDHSCALFDAKGRLLAQAEHIPVHLGAMRASVQVALRLWGAERGGWRSGDVVALNDPAAGGTHLPDLTLISPVMVGRELVGFVGNRAHHADVGGSVPGSMPASSREIFEEGLIVPPLKLVEAGRLDAKALQLILANVRVAAERRGDLRAQIAANALGARRFVDIARRTGGAGFEAHCDALLDSGEAIAKAAITRFPQGSARAVDFLEGDGIVDDDIPIRAHVRVRGGTFEVDFGGTAPQSGGNVNAPPAVAEACVLFVARHLLAPHGIMNEGLARRTRIRIPQGSILHPRPGAAVAAGNVETSQRTVDVLLAALRRIAPDRVPAASQGTMNNITIGSVPGQPAAGSRADPAERWAYYETLGGGEGATPTRDGQSGLHTYMTNTRNTPVEALEHAFPLRILRYTLRPATGGPGRFRGGDGLLREIEILSEAAIVSLQTDRRRRGAPGAAGGLAGTRGRNAVQGRGETAWNPVPAKTTVRLSRGDKIRIETPGGGGFGQRRPKSS
ncbi:MAG: hydantoinase B/oxoprolinase family protein [Thermoplasmatota archaeon]